MKQYLKMLIFILALGAISAGLLIGVDLLTSERIEKNKMFELYGSILDANEIEYNQTNFDQVFNDNFDVLEALENANNPKPAYQHKVTKNISFEFSGNGMWGPIKGVITLKEDALTIVAMRILEQEETPGLGARIIEQEFLDRFIDKKFPNINIIKDRLPSSDHEILGLTGATTTTGKLQGVINSEFMNFYRNYIGDDLDQGAELEKFVRLLAEHGVELGDRNLDEVLNETFEIVEKEELTLYINNKLGLVSYITNADIKFSLNGAETENITIITTLESDKETVRSIVGVYEPADGHWGKVQFLDVLDAKGAKFPNIIIQPGAGSGDIDGGAGVTHTREGFEQAINNAYDLYKDLLDTVVVEGGDFRPSFVITEDDIKNKILNVLGLPGRKFDEVMVTITDENLYVELDSLQTVYVVKTKMHFGFNADEEDIVIIVFIDQEQKITKVAAIFEENSSHEAKIDLLREEALDNLIGEQLPNIVLNIPGAKYYPTEANELERTINQGYERNKQAILDIKYDELAKLKLQKAVLKAQGYDVDKILIQEFNDLFEKVIAVVENGDDTLYINKENNKITIDFIALIRFGRNLPDAEYLNFYLTISPNFKTIIDVSVIHDANSSHWGKTRLLTDEVLVKLKGYKFPNIDLIKVNDEGKDEVLGITGVTGTGEDLNNALNEAYDRNVDKIKEQFTVNIKDDKTYVINNETNVITYYYEAELTFGFNGNAKDSVLIFVTKEADFNKLTNITVIHDGNDRHWGKTRLFIDSILTHSKGKTIEQLFKALEGKYEYDSVTGVTYTATDFRNILLEKDALYKASYGGTK